VPWKEKVKMWRLERRGRNWENFRGKNRGVSRKRKEKRGIPWI